jgi:hypothetical protein
MLTAGTQDSVAWLAPVAQFWCTTIVLGVGHGSGGDGSG